MDERKQYGKLSVLEPVGVTRHYPKKRTILFQGEVPASVMVLRSGIVKVYGITGDGDQRTVTILTAGDVFPMSWVFGKSQQCIYYFEALTDCTVLAVSKEDYEHALATNLELKEQIFQNYMSHYVAATMHVYALEHSYAQDKLIYILQYLVTRFGEKQDDGRCKIGLRLSHQDIAEMVGITRETAAVELHKLKAKELIDYQKFTYIVDCDRLFHTDRGDEFDSLELKHTLPGRG
ncbi:Crp/Fnr family transcriptional regulator [Candidatus Saccharibacteria bacterium]|jgi:CRP/FNR family transcriptional regulator|nr:MAG: Crp/Fnr family transcriptional regulator [Candidatus Saccharibacteria bacterium]